MYIEYLCRLLSEKLGSTYFKGKKPALQRILDTDFRGYNRLTWPDAWLGLSSASPAKHYGFQYWNRSLTMADVCGFDGGCFPEIL